MVLKGLIVGIVKEIFHLPEIDNGLILTWPSNTGHKLIVAKVYITTIDLFKQLKCALELKLLNIKKM